MSDVFDLAAERRKAMLRAAGYEYGIARYAVPNPALVTSIVDVAQTENDHRHRVVLLAPPDAIADAWILNPEEAEAIATRLIHAAAEARARNASGSELPAV